MIILESLACEEARRKGAGELAVTAARPMPSASPMIQPDGRGAAGRDDATGSGAGISPRETGGRTPPVQYISAHGTGTKENDKIETAAVKAVFGCPACRSAALRACSGNHPGCRAVELMTCIKAIETGIVPPTMNLKTPDPVCDLDYVPNAPARSDRRGRR